MNVVGRFGSLITQGVYSVATPFHPFGGAVDVIVVQQQDGSFRSTPWYVRFGKFQGVLKGQEKIVRINVNGIEADFHMYLDNSGEAYFIHEVESGKASEANGTLNGSSSRRLPELDESIIYHDNNGNKNKVEICRLEHSVSDSGVVQLQEELDPSSPRILERSESDGDRRYYDFQDDHSSMEDSVEFSEFGSNRYESLDDEHNTESQATNSEVILVSVDGHVLTAPVLASEKTTENVQLSTPQFHLGPGEGTEVFDSGDNAWADDYISKLNASASNVSPSKALSLNNDDNVLIHQMEVCEGNGERVCQIQETQNISGLERDLQTQIDSEDVSISVTRKEVFKSCLELMELVKDDGNADSKDLDSSLEFQYLNVESPHGSLVVDQSGDGNPVELNESPHDSKVVDQSGGGNPVELNEESPHGSPAVDQAGDGISIEFGSDALSLPSDSSSTRLGGSPAVKVEVEAVAKNDLLTESLAADDIYASSDRFRNDQEQKNDESCTSIASEALDGCQQKPPAPEDGSSDADPMGPKVETSIVDVQTCSSIRFEISLCGKELHVGMGLDAAAKVFEAHHVSIQEFKNSAASIMKNEDLIIRYGQKYLSWEKAAPYVLGLAAFGLDLPIEPEDAIPVEQGHTPKLRDDDAGITSTSSGRRWRLWPIPFRRVKKLEHSNSNASSDELFLDFESDVQNSNVESPSASNGGYESPHKQFIRTNVPTSEQIASLNLKDGQNIITFSFSTRVLGTQQVDAHIYLWKWNARIVISDVDGTITKSDVLGQFMPLVGKDWTQSGVAKLFSAIKENGYQLLFLSARAIVQAYLTRSFLLNLKQDGKALPNGPVVISPDGLFPSLYREVIRRAPHEFKIACLEDIKKLFPPDYNPFYAGFGNRDTDELSYRKIGIPKGKIFIINPKGEVAISHRIGVKSYTSLHTLVNDMFPPTTMVEQEDYNSWNYWKVPLPDVD